MEHATALETALTFFTPGNLAYTAMAALGGWLILAALLGALVNARGGRWPVFLKALRALSIGAACVLTLFAAPVGLYFIGKAVWIAYQGDGYPRKGRAAQAQSL